MENDEVIKGNLLDAGGNYSFQAGKFFNLEGSPFIKGHGDVTGKRDRRTRCGRRLGDE